MQERNFTKAEAHALIGKTFESLVEFSGVPKGTRGKVVAADKQGLGHWDVVIEWELPDDAAGRSRRLRDWFSHDEMQRFMREV
jgi:hypothetical protein